MDVKLWLYKFVYLNPLSACVCVCVTVYLQDHHFSTISSHVCIIYVQFSHETLEGAADRSIISS